MCRIPESCHVIKCLWKHLPIFVFPRTCKAAQKFIDKCMENQKFDWTTSSTGHEAGVRSCATASNEK